MLTVFPLSRGWVNNTEELVVCDRLRIQVDDQRLLLHVLVGFVQRLPDHALTGAGVADDEDRVTHIEELLKLDYLVIWQMKYSESVLLHSKLFACLRESNGILKLNRTGGLEIQSSSLHPTIGDTLTQKQTPMYIYIYLFIYLKTLHEHCIYSEQ